MAECCTYEFQKKHFGFVDADVSDFTESQWCSSRLAFVIYRIIIFIYWTAWAIEGVVEYSKLENGHFYYIYLSHWNDWALAIHFAMSISVATCGLKDSNFPLRGSLRWWHKISWMVRDVSIVSSYLVTIMFYSAGVHSRTSLASSIHRHAISSCIHTVDLFVSKLPVRFLHFCYSSLYFSIYAAFTLILHWSGVISRLYDKMVDWEMVPGVSIVVFISVVLIISPMLHSLVFVFYRFRLFLANRFGCALKLGRGQIVSDGISDDDVKDGRVSSCDSNI